MRLWGFPSSPEDVREYHSGMLATWVEQATNRPLLNDAGEPCTEMEKRNMGPYLQGWHPYIYLWGPRGDNLKENYERIIGKLSATKRTTINSFMPRMLDFYHQLPVNEMRHIHELRDTKYDLDKKALTAFGDFCGIMSDREIWSPVVTCTDHGGFAFDALAPKAFPKHIYWQAHFHPAYHDAVNRMFKKTGNQMGLERGMRWYEMFVLGGEHVGDHPILAPAYAQHVAFCEANGLLP